jgi:serine/threonine protein kinase
MVFQAHPGDILAGKYRVDKVLGIGGMGMVVAATHLELEQQFALKFMLGELATSANLLDRFMREARAVAKLRGEHVCRVHDVGRLENGSPYIVMELLKGEDFAAVLSREGKLSPQVAVGYLLQAIEGVAEAHAEGIVHRDLKPGNLFITASRDGRPLVKVLDFGISKSSSAPATRTGDIMGSPGYMAPEQMSNAKDTDARTDVWALGVILYQALAAQMPWSGDSLPALCMSVISDPPPPLPEDVPEGLRGIVMRCLAKERDGRWSNVGELARELARFGDADSSATATRITRIVSATITQLPTTASTGVAPTVTSGDTALAAGAPINGVSAPSTTEPDRKELATVAARPVRDEASTPPIRPISTFSSSAAELKVPPVEQPAKSNKTLWIAGAGVLAAGSVALAIGLGRDRGDSTTEPTPVASAPTPSPSVQPPAETPLQIGKRVFVSKGCNSCHTVDGKPSVGPTFAGAWGSVVSLANGDRVHFDEAYFRESLIAPNARIRAGFPAAQPSYEGQLTEAEIVGLMTYVQSVASAPAPVAEKVDCTLPGKLDLGGKQAAEYKCSKIDFKTRSCQCGVGSYAMRTPDDVAICHELRPGCDPPLADPVVTKPATRPTTTVTTRPATKPGDKPVEPKPTEPKKPDELWMQMTHDKDKK